MVSDKKRVSSDVASPRQSRSVMLAACPGSARAGLVGAKLQPFSPVPYISSGVFQRLSVISISSVTLTLRKKQLR